MHYSCASSSSSVGEAQQALVETIDSGVGVLVRFHGSGGRDE